MNLTIDFQPFFPLWAIAGLGLAGLALAAFALWRGMRGTVLRLLALALLVLALLNPSLLQEEREQLSSVAAVVVDQSASNRLEDREAQTEAARAALAESFDGLEEVELRWIEAGGEEGADGTALFSALSAGLADVPPERVAGAVLLTDGQVHDIPERAAEIGFDAPVHALVTGHDAEIDRRLVLHDAPRFGIVGEERPLTFRVEDRGVDGATPRNPGEGRARIVISRDGEAIEQRDVTPGDNVTVPVEIAHAGKNFFEIEAEPIEGEITTQNNRVVVVTEGIRENLRVLLVSGEPHVGERTWRNLLKSDAAVDLVHFTILRPPEKQDGTPINELSLIAFPTRELFQVKIDEFDLIIFDRYQRRGVLPLMYYDNIARYVREGGAVMIAAGPDYAGMDSIYRSPLSDVLPAQPVGSMTEEPYHARITETGERHPVTRGLPGAGSEPPDWSRWFRLVDVETPDRGETIMAGPDDKPLLLLSREGEGRVALMLSDHAWLWARGYEGGGPHVDLLRRVSHWLMQEPDLEEEAMRLSQSGRDLVVERQTMGDEAGPVTLTRPDGTTEEVALAEAQPGIWRASVEAPELGLYRAEDGELSALANVGPLNPREFADPLSTTEALASVGEETGGAVMRIGSDGEDIAVPRVLAVRAGAAAHGSDWIGMRRTSASELLGVSTLPLFAGLLGLALLLGAVSAMWYREGR